VGSLVIGPAMNKSTGVRVTRAVSSPVREGLTWSERWEGPDRGLVACWETGLKKSRQEPELAALARTGVLMVLPWKGGIERATKLGRKFGSLRYLAMWQGLRGDALDVSLDKEVTLICTKTGMSVTYTPDRTKYAEK
jgi:hypothetical protein